MFPFSSVLEFSFVEGEERIENNKEREKK